MSPRRKQILERAAGVIYQQGFGASTVADIIKAAAIGRGNFYHHFTNKEDLGLAIIDELAHAIGGTEHDEIFSPLKPPAARLSDYLAIVRRSCRQGSAGDPLCTLASELGSTPPYCDRIRIAMHALIDRLEALVSEYAVESGVKVDANRLARAIVAQTHGLCTQLKVDRDAEAFERGIAAVPDILIGAVAMAQGGVPAIQSRRAEAMG
jgi:TetR/AcrR family transcriptional repressor of nem operon